MKVLKQLNADLFKDIKKEIIFGILEIIYGFACFPIMIILGFLVIYNSDYIYLMQIVFWVYILGVFIIAAFFRKNVFYAYFFFTLKRKYLDMADNFEKNKMNRMFFVLLIMYWIYIFIKLLTKK